MDLQVPFPPHRSGFSIARFLITISSSIVPSHVDIIRLISHYFELLSSSFSILFITSLYTCQKSQSSYKSASTLSVVLSNSNLNYRSRRMSLISTLPLVALRPIGDTRKRFGLSPLAIILFTCSSSEIRTLPGLPLCRGYGDCGWLPRRKEAKKFNFERFFRRSVFNFCLEGFLVRGVTLPGSGVGIGVETSSCSPTPRFASWSANSASRRRSRERVRRCGSKILCSLFFQEFFLSGEGWRLEENRGSADMYLGRVSSAHRELSIV